MENSIKCEKTAGPLFQLYQEQFLNTYCVQVRLFKGLAAWAVR